jgi:hypothetical protein
VKIFKYPIIGLYTPLRTPRRTCRYFSGPEILEVRNYLPQYNVTTVSLDIKLLYVELSKTVHDYFKVSVVIVVS